MQTVMHVHVLARTCLYGVWLINKGQMNSMGAGMSTMFDTLQRGGVLQWLKGLPSSYCKSSGKCRQRRPHRG